MACRSDKSCEGEAREEAELALLMRAMFEETMEMKRSIKDGVVPDHWERFQTIHSAVPTNPSIKGPIYQGFAENYLQQVDRLAMIGEADHAEFNVLVDACMACHREFCPGPMVRIKKLYLPKEEY